MRIQIDIPQDAVEPLVRAAIMDAHFTRAEPRKAWSDKERREAIRFYFENLVAEAANLGDDPLGDWHGRNR